MSLDPEPGPEPAVRAHWLLVRVNEAREELRGLLPLLTRLDQHGVPADEARVALAAAAACLQEAARALVRELYGYGPPDSPPPYQR